MIRNFLSNIRNRSTSIRFNVLISFLAKAIGVGSSFIAVPLLLLYLDDIRYGIWLTLSSVLQWISLFDFGLGNGFRNKFVIAKANNDQQLASEYVSTSYFVIGILSVLIIVLFIITFSFFDLSPVFNAPKTLASEINLALLVIGSLQAIKFCVDLISFLLISDQKVGLSNLIYSFSTLLVPVGYFIFAQFYKINLINLAAIFLLIPIIILVIISFFFFNGIYSIYKPSIKNIRIGKIRELMSLGGRFFLLQISVLIVFTTDNIIIANLFGPESVIPYNIAFKYFSIINFIFIIIITPLWAAFTKEFELGNYIWIKSTLKKVIVIWAVLSIMAIAMLFCSNSFYYFWVGNEVKVSFFLSFSMMIFVIISNWNNIIWHSIFHC